MSSPPSALAETAASPPSIEPCHRLWAAVLELQIRDAQSAKKSRLWGIKMAERDSALQWLMKNTRDFNMVCELAGLEPESIRRWVRGMVSRRS